MGKYRFNELLTVERIEQFTRQALPHQLLGDQFDACNTMRTKWLLNGSLEGRHGPLCRLYGGGVTVLYRKGAELEGEEFTE